MFIFVFCEKPSRSKIKECWISSNLENVQYCAQTFSFCSLFVGQQKAAMNFSFYSLLARIAPIDQMMLGNYQFCWSFWKETVNKRNKVSFKSFKITFEQGLRKQKKHDIWENRSMTSSIVPVLLVLTQITFISPLFTGCLPENQQREKQ